MEGITLVRLGTIGGLLLGSLYVLAPTFLQEDIESRGADAAAQLNSNNTKSSKANLLVEFTSPDADAVRPIVETRLRAAGVGINRVTAADGKVVVQMKSGTARSNVIDTATAPGIAKLYDPNAIAPVPELLPPVPASAPHDPRVFEALAPTGDAIGHWANVANSWADAGVPGGVPALDVSIDSFDGSLVKVDGVLPEGVPFAVVAVDGSMVGLGFPAGSDLIYTKLSTSAQGTSGTEYFRTEAGTALLKGGRLPAALEPIALPEVEEGSEEEVPEEVAVSSVLDFFPDTAISLGLDLQGGLDLTLQVELDDAVMAQVARDAASMRDQAEREKVVVTKVRKDKVEPMVWFEGAEQSEISGFLSGKFPDYSLLLKEDGKLAYAMREDRIEAVKKQSVEQVLETLRKRVDATGVKEPSIVKKNGGRINIQLPGVEDQKTAIDAIGKTALLEFRMVDPKQDPALLTQILQQAENALPEDQWADDNIVNDYLWENKLLDEDRRIVWHYEEAGRDMKRVDYSANGKEGPLITNAEVVLTGNDINDASVGFDQNNSPYVALNFKPRGADIFCTITTEHVKERFAILLDGQLRSAPSIRQRICGGRASIDMGDSRVNAVDDANTLALVLRTGSLDAPVSIGQVRLVGASLGQDSIRAGSLASLAGGLIVLFFMALWYRTAGMIANVALVLNVLMVIAALALFGATLTLPGIAGIALTVGMAVDANIIIFERIREELAMGVQPRKAVDTGFSKGLVAVLDANITTAIAGVVLFSYGTGPIKGFAVTLLIGIVTTLITALFVTRTFMELATRSSNARISI